MFLFGRVLGRKITNTPVISRQHTSVEPLEIRPEEMRPAEKPTKDVARRQPSERYLKFKEKLRSNAPIVIVAKQGASPLPNLQTRTPAWPNNTNPLTGEINGPRGPEPTRYGDWQSKGRVTDF